MYTFVATIHILASVTLILVVLLQSGKGGMGAAFGGASQTVFGARGAGSLLGKMTAGIAITFMCTSLTLAYLSTSQDKSLREAAEQREERAKARELPGKRKRTKAKTGPMSSGRDAGAAAAPSEGTEGENAEPAEETGGIVGPEETGGASSDAG